MSKRLFKNSNGEWEEITPSAVDLSGYQTKLTFDNTPTSGSTNPVTSGGVYSALSGKVNTSDLAVTQISCTTGLISPTYAAKCGHTVQISIDYRTLAEGTYNNDSILFTIPYKPSTTKGIMFTLMDRGSTTPVQLYVKSNGDVAFAGSRTFSSTCYLHGSIVYLTND